MKRAPGSSRGLAPASRRRLRLALLPALALCAPAPALDRLSLSAADVAGPGWRAGGVELALDLERYDAPRLSLRVARLELPAPFDSLRAASVRCAATRAPGGALRCSAGRLELSRDGAPPLVLVAALQLDPETASVRLDAAEQPLLGGLARLALRAGPTRLSLDLEASGLDATGLVVAAPPLPGTGSVTVSAGRLDLRLSLQAAAGEGRLDATARARELAFSDASGLHAGEGLALTARLRAQGGEAAWTAQIDAAMEAGAVYAHPLLLQVGGEALTVHASVQRAAGVLAVRELRLHDPGGLEAEGSARLALAPEMRLESLDLVVAPTPAEALYRRYLQPFAGAGPLADLVVEGRVGARVSWRAAGASRATLALDGVGAGDAGGRFALIGVNGDLDWRSGEAPGEGRLEWRALQLGPLELGPGRALLSMHGRSLSLLQPVEAALLDGAVQLQRLEASSLGLPEQRIEADLSLRPLSLARLSERLAWLPLAGQIGGLVPRLVLDGRRLVVEGELVVDLFDGRVRVSGLSLEEPFGVVPRLRADLALDGIDLGLLSRAFSFGSVEGRLDGRVRSLVLERWQPVSFDAWFGTPEGDESRHRISQRAVDNLASLGGANAVLSSTFLRVFSEFSYDRLGVSCRLRGGVCEMGGVAPAERGYYLVKGGGMPPRVDVVGFNDRVDWDTLLARLRAVAASSGPVVR